MKHFPILPVCKTWIVNVFVGNSTAADFFVAAIADIGYFFQPVSKFLAEISASLIAGGTGGAFDAAQDDFSAGIGFPAVIAVGTEVSGIIKEALFDTSQRVVGFSLLLRSW